MNKSNPYTSWEPQFGWLVALPSRTPDKQGKIILPESFTKKSNSGIVIKTGDPKDTGEYLNQEIFFPTHAEHQIIDSDTNVLLYLVPENQVILTRTPPADINRVSREKERDVSNDRTIQPIERSNPSPEYGQ